MTTQPEHPTIHPTAAEPPRYCRRCGYELRGLTAPRCPECGRVFDPANPRTYLLKPIRRWLRHVKPVAIVLLIFLMVLVATWGWLYWGWYDEQQTLDSMKISHDNALRTSILPFMPDGEHDPYFFVITRIDSLIIHHRSDITDISLLSQFRHLSDLDARETKITNVLPLARLLKLERLSLDDSPITNISPLARLTKLEYLSLQNIPITDISPLANLTNLETLSLNDTAITDVSPLARLKNLRFVYLSNTKIKNLSPLAELSRVDRLSLAATSITDISPLSGLIELKLLNLAKTKVNDLSPLTHLTKLTELYLHGTSISDLSPLYTLKSLRILSVPKESITQDQYAELHRTLPHCKILVQK